jgi:hypothetical protein
MVVDDHAAVAVQDSCRAARGWVRLDAIALGLLVVDLRVLDLQVPEAGDEEQEDEDAGVLEDGDFAGGEFDVFAAGLFAGQLGLMIEFRTDGWRVHVALRNIRRKRRSRCAAELPKRSVVRRRRRWPPDLEEIARRRYHAVYPSNCAPCFRRRILPKRGSRWSWRSGAQAARPIVAVPLDFAGSP